VSRENQEFEIMLKLKGLREHEPLSAHTTFGMGGTARYFVEVATPDDLVEPVTVSREMGLHYAIIAGGSNVVIADGHFGGLVIRICGGEMVLEGYEITVDAGVQLMALITYVIKNGLGGLETLSGIPGTVGGALVGNAAAYGQAIGDTIVNVEIFDPQTGKRETLSHKSCGFRYRDSHFNHHKKGVVILRARFRFVPAEREVLEKKSQEIIAIRAKKYPPGLRTPGSFFKNLLAEKLPQHVLDTVPNLKDFYGKVPAWHFLNEVGARGMRHGGLRIADFHGNYIINDGAATYEDVRELAAELKKRVREKFGVELEEEIRYIEPHGEKNEI